MYLSFLLMHIGWPAIRRTNSVAATISHPPNGNAWNWQRAHSELVSYGWMLTRPRTALLLPLLLMMMTRNGIDNGFNSFKTTFPTQHTLDALYSLCSAATAAVNTLLNIMKCSPFDIYPSSEDCSPPPSTSHPHKTHTWLNIQRKYEVKSSVCAIWLNLVSASAKWLNGDDWVARTDTLLWKIVGDDVGMAPMRNIKRARSLLPDDSRPETSAPNRVYDNHATKFNYHFCSHMMFERCTVPVSSSAMHTRVHLP